MHNFDWLEIEFGLLHLVINSRFTQVQVQDISLERGNILVCLIRKDLPHSQVQYGFLNINSISRVNPYDFHATFTHSLIL